jgi:hypothetical protein
MLNVAARQYRDVVRGALSAPQTVPRQAEVPTNTVLRAS